MMKIYYTHMVNVTIESEAWVMGHYIAAEGGLEKSSFKFRSEDTDGFGLSNGYSGSEGQRCGSQTSHGKMRQIWSVTHLISGDLRSGVSG